MVQAWNAKTGQELPAFPQAVEDYQLLSSPAVADVSDAPGNEILVGTGLYYLRDINANGVEGPGWPKFTGGWIFAVPAIGDVDGDGKLEVAAPHARGLRLPVGHGPSRVRHERRVVDLAPRRVEHRRVRNRLAARPARRPD